MDQVALIALSSADTPRHHDHDRDNQPPAAVDGRADQQASRTAEDAHRGDPPHPHRVGADPVGQRTDNPAHRDQHPRHRLPGGQPGGQWHANRQRGQAHPGPRHRAAGQPGQLDQPPRNPRWPALPGDGSHSSLPPGTDNCQPALPVTSRMASLMVILLVSASSSSHGWP
jgi:hypothetical protein